MRAWTEPSGPAPAPRVRTVIPPGGHYQLWVIADYPQSLYTVDTPPPAPDRSLQTMSPQRLLRALYRAIVRLLPRRFHTRRMAAESRVLRLSDEQREQLARNLRRMLRPKAA